MKKCKICNSEIPNNRIYCGNKCKYLDSELNSKRARKEKNDVDKKLKCKLCEWQTKDILNLGGHPKKHLKEKHNIVTDNYIEYFNEIKIISPEKWNCPLCDWSTIDLNNKSGCITHHIKNKHNMTLLELIDKYPEKKIDNDRNERLKLIRNNNVECKICGEKLLFITNSHLRKHKITQEQYKNIYGDIIISDYTKDKLKPLGGTKNFIYTSKQENEISKYIESLGYNVIKNYKKLGTEIDIFIPDKNVGIEFNGLYWHSELNGKNKNYHIDKTEICQSNNIQLIHIFEDEWKNKNDIIKSKIKHILRVNNLNKIYARNCHIKEISIDEKNKFLNTNHIQGADKSKICIAAYYKNNLVSVMTFSKLRISMGNKNSEDGVFELVRFASNINFNVIGTFSKILKYFINKYSPKKIITYADIRFTKKTDNLYEKNGFKFVKQTKPNYYYMKRYEKRLHRFNFTKHNILKKMGGKKELSEWENMKMFGYDRIWDCGSYKYEMSFFN